MIETVQYNSTHSINHFKKFSMPAFHTGFFVGVEYIYLPFYCHCTIQYVCVTAGTLAHCPVGAISANQQLIGSLDLYFKSVFSDRLIDN
jgi:hypothetical protein